MIFDSDPREKIVYGITVKYPDFEEIRKQSLTVLIGSENYEREMEIELLKNGCENLIKLPTLFNEKWEIISTKYFELFPKIEGVTIPYNFLTNKDWISRIVC